MNIRYTRLTTSDVVNSIDIAKWARTRLPVAFLKQQILLVSLVISSFVLFIFTSLFTSNIDYQLIQDYSNDLNYGVIVDCGSSGTRAHIFKWKKHSILSQVELVRDQTTGKPLSKHITPGVSSLKDNPDKASEYMDPIMVFISKSIPHDRHSDTPIYFMATAGLRLLNDLTQKQIMSDLEKDLRIKFNFPRIKSQVITGEYEGIYSWLSLNIKKKLYGLIQEKPSKSYGMIEMGGASTQVTFELNPEVENSILKNLQSTDSISAFQSEQRTVKIGPNNSVKLFATTFLGLGVNTARDSAIDLLILNHLKQTNQQLPTKESELSKYEIRIKDPCLTTGSSEIVHRPTLLLKHTNQTIGFVIREREETFSTRVEGTGDYFECKNLLERILLIVKQEKLNCLPTKPCSMKLLGTDFIPFSHFPFVGLSEMYFTTNEMMNAAGSFNRTKILHETKRICETDYNKLLKMYSNNGVSFEDRILYECFKASWMLTLLHNYGFRMPEDYDNFKTLDRLAGEEIDWTIGAITTEVALNRINLDK